MDSPNTPPSIVLLGPFNATVATTFFGFNRANVDFVLTKEEIDKWDRRIIRHSGDIIYYDLSSCAYPNRAFWYILHYSFVALICLCSILFQFSLYRPFLKLATKNGPPFLILLNLLFCSTINLIFGQFQLYFESALGFRPPIPFDLDYFLRMPFNRGEIIFYFLYSLNRCAALLFPILYNKVFTKRNIYWMIFWAWAFTFLESGERLMSSKGMNRAHCLAPNDQLDDNIQTYFVILDPWIKLTDRIIEKIFSILWYSPAVIDIFTLAKLFYDKYAFGCSSPWIVVRPVVSSSLARGQNERIRLFLVCFCTTVFHFLFGFIFFYRACLYPRQYFNYSYILENAMPFLLMVAISRDVRSAWIQKNSNIFEGFKKYFCFRCSQSQRSRRISPIFTGMGISRRAA